MTEQAAAPIGQRWQKAKIAAIVPRTPRITSFMFDLPEPFDHVAGQHVDLRLTAPDGYTAMRSYSIASAPGNPLQLELAIELLEAGEVSPFFHDVVEVGDAIELKGPLGGHFVWQPQDGGPLLLIGGGSGVVPLMSMIRQRMAEAADVPVALLLSARTWDDILYRDELLAFEEAGNGFTLVFALTREAPRRPGDHARRVDDAIMAAIAAGMPAPPRRVFVCGTNAFVNAAADGAIAAGLPAAPIRTERYGG